MTVISRGTKSIGIALVIGVVGLLGPASAFPERQGVWSSDEGSYEKGQQPQQVMQQAMETMGPMMGKMAGSMMEGMLLVMKKPETAESLATFSRNYYDALRKKGFSEEAALRMVTAIGLPAAPSGMK